MNNEVLTFWLTLPYESVELRYGIAPTVTSNETPLIRRVRAILIADYAAENMPTPVNTRPINSFKRLGMAYA